MPSPAEPTKILRDLNAVPEASRDDEWYVTLFETLPVASYALVNKEPVKAPDGFYYFNFSLLPEGKDTKGFEIISFDDETLEDCLDRAAGIVIYPDLACKQEPVWILSYGEIQSYYNYESFAGDPEDLEEIVDAEENGISSDEDINITTPDETFIHKGARKFLKQFFDALGFEGVEIALLQDKSQAPSRALLLSLFPDDFKSHEQIEDALNTVSWLLPPHRPVTLNDSYPDEHFIAL